MSSSRSPMSRSVESKSRSSKPHSNATRAEMRSRPGMPEQSDRAHVRCDGSASLPSPIPAVNKTSSRGSAESCRFIEKGRTVADGEGQVTRIRSTTCTRGASRTCNAGCAERPVRELQVLWAQQRRRCGYADGRRKSDASRNATIVLGRMASVTDALGKTTTFAYDAANNLIRVTDALSRQTRLEYDDLNRRTAVVELGYLRIPVRNSRTTPTAT